MSAKVAKVLGDKKKVILDIKGRRLPQPAKLDSGAICSLVPQHFALDEETSVRYCKRVRSGHCKDSCNCIFRDSLRRNYADFMKSALPQRVLFNQNDDWKDFPMEIISMLRADFQEKKAITEVAVEGKSTLFDFLHMVHIDTETGMQQPIAWIDESGGCFFPYLYSGNQELLHRPGSYERGFQNDEKMMQNGRQKVELQLKIANSGVCEVAYVPRAKRLRIVEKPAAIDYDMKQESNNNLPILGNASEDSNIVPKHDELEKLMIGGSDYNAIQNMFLESFASFVCVDDIVGISRVSPKTSSVRARLQIFQKQVEIMNANRGCANVRYAWFVSSEEKLLRIMYQRFELTDISKSNCTYGIGIYLIPAKCSSIRSVDFDDIKSGTQHMLLCRVIMGNMELIPSGSEQFHPSSANYDSGVDNLQNPKYYIIWDTHMNSHIYPEYIVNFKGSLKSKVLGESLIDTSGVTCKAHCGQLQNDSSPFGLDCCKLSYPKKHCQEKARPTFECARVPSSPWMPFPLLLAAVSGKISSQDKDLVYRYYDEFKVKTITRAAFIKELRSIIGDDILRDTITGLLQIELTSSVKKEVK